MTEGEPTGFVGAPPPVPLSALCVSVASVSLRRPLFAFSRSRLHVVLMRRVFLVGPCGLLAARGGGRRRAVAGEGGVTVDGDLHRSQACRLDLQTAEAVQEAVDGADE